MKRHHIALIVVAALLGVSLVSGLITERLAKHIIETELHKVAGITVQVGDYGFSLWRGSVELKDVKLFPAGKLENESLLASADKLYVKVSLFSLLGEHLNAKKVILVNPKLSYILEKDNRSNWYGIKPIRVNVTIDDIQIKNGSALYQDKRLGQRFDLEDVNVEVDHIVPARSPGALPTSVFVSAGIANTSAKLRVEGEASLFGDGISFDVKGSLSPTPVGLFAAYYRGQVPYPVIGGAIAIAISAKAEDSKFTSTNRVTLSGLRVGGGLKGDIINKFILAQAGSIVFNVNASGDLSTGEFSMGNTLSKNIAGELAARAMSNAPGAMAKDVDKDVVKPIEKGFKSLFKKH